MFQHKIIPFLSILYSLLIPNIHCDIFLKGEIEGLKGGKTFTTSNINLPTVNYNYRSGASGVPAGILSMPVQYAYYSYSSNAQPIGGLPSSGIIPGGQMASGGGFGNYAGNLVTGGSRSNGFIPGTTYYMYGGGTPSFASNAYLPTGGYSYGSSGVPYGGKLRASIKFPLPRPEKIIFEIFF